MRLTNRYNNKVAVNQLSIRRESIQREARYFRRTNATQVSFVYEVFTNFVDLRNPSIRPYIYIGAISSTRIRTNSAFDSNFVRLKTLYN